jgi:ribonuclease P protein component
MFSKKNRLTLKKDILKTKKGESAKGAFFVVRIIKNNLGMPRVAISISKKVSLKSVDRNLIKRRTSEVIRLILKGTEPFDIFIISLPESKNASYKDIELDIKKTLKNLGVIDA